VRGRVHRQVGMMALVSLLLALTVAVSSPRWGAVVAAALAASVLAAYLAIRRWGERP